MSHIRHYLYAIAAMLVAVLLAYILLSIARDDDVHGQAIVLMLPPSPWDREMLELDRQALREAYVEKMKALFSVWVREGLDNPERPVKGAAQTRRAFVEIMKVYEARAQQIEQREQK